MTRTEAIKYLVEQPARFGHMVGFTKLTDLHNGWIRDMLFGEEDETLQAHRGSYKTTCVALALALEIILLPNIRAMFMRKTDDDVKEIIQQVIRILRTPQASYFVSVIYGVKLTLYTASTFEIRTNLTTDVRGTPQLVGVGSGGAITGKHFDRIFTDDIINLKDRLSRAERERTKSVYQELINIKNRGGRIFNTGTPWHKDDAFSIMPAAKVYDCYSTGIISEEEIAELKESMLASLFAANYEMRHIAAEDVIFADPAVGASPHLVENGVGHIDVAYGGGDWTAFTICRKAAGIYYVLGKCWHKHVDDVKAEIIRLRQKYLCGKVWIEDNADKGYLARDLRNSGERIISYHESMNKYYKITTYLKGAWQNVVFVDGTDPEYIEMIVDYNENAEHDDSPDSLASIIRQLWNKKDRNLDDY